MNYKVIYDRKSPRRRWELFGCCPDNGNIYPVQHLADGCRRWASREGWEQYQQGVTEADSPDDPTATLPRNTRLAPLAPIDYAQEAKQ